MAITDPDLIQSQDGAVGRFLLRMETQLAYQLDVFRELSRTAALFDQTSTSKNLKTLAGNWPERLLGCSLHNYVGASIVLYTSALRNSGVFDIGWMYQPQFADAAKIIPAEVLQEIIESHYVANICQLKELQDNAYRLRENQKPPIEGSLLTPWRAVLPWQV